MKLYYRVEGSGIPVMILHGLYSSSDSWLTIARKLAADGFRSFIPDLRNHGRSPHNALHNYKSMAEDIFELSETLDLSKFFVVGHSMGGKLALQFMHDYPEKVIKTVSVDMSPFAYNFKSSALNHEEVLNFINRFDLSKLKRRTDLIAFLPKQYQSDPHFFLKNIRRGANKKMRWKINAAAILEHLAEIRAEVPYAPKRECLFVKGELSDYISDEDLKNLEEYPDTEITIIRGGEHRLHWQKPVLLSNLITDFIKK